MTNKFDCFESEYFELVDRFNHILENNNRIFLSGSFGVGKTTFIEQWEKSNLINKNTVKVKNKKYKLVKISAFTDFHSSSFIDVLETKLFNRKLLLIREYWLSLFLIFFPLVFIILKLFFELEINTSTVDILTFTLGLSSVLIAFHQYNINKILENRSARIVKKCSKSNYFFVIDDFDRLVYLFDSNETVSTITNKQKENILKIMGMIESTENIILFVGDLKSNNMNFLEKYYDYIYEFPAKYITSVIKQKFVNYWGDRVEESENVDDLALYKDFARYFINYDGKTNLRDIFRLSKHLDLTNLERLNKSEVIISHFLFYIHHENYVKIFKILARKKQDFMNSEKYHDLFNELKFLDEDSNGDEELKKLVRQWLNIEKWKRNSSGLVMISPPGDRMEFQTCDENHYIYLVNQFDNDEYTYEEFLKKILDLDYWVMCNTYPAFNRLSNNDNVYYNMNRFYDKLKQDKVFEEVIKLLLNNIYKLQNINDVGGFIRGISHISNWDFDAHYSEHYEYIGSIVDFDADIQGKVIYLSQILMYKNSKIPEKENEILINFLKQSVSKMQKLKDEYLCTGWLSLFFYTQYAKYIDSDIAIEFWKNNKHLYEYIRKYYFEGDKLSPGYFHIGKENYDNEVNIILYSVDGVKEAIEKQDKSTRGMI